MSLKKKIRPFLGDESRLLDNLIYKAVVYTEWWHREANFLPFADGKESLKNRVCVKMGRLLFDLLNILFVTFFSSIKGQEKTISALEHDQIMTCRSHMFNCKDPL